MFVCFRSRFKLIENSKSVVLFVGLVRKKVRLAWESKQIEVEALIDTGTNRLIVPKDVAERLGLKPLFKVKAELVGESVKEVDVAPVLVEIMGKKRTRLCSNC
jgi:predicted aspartyl protease